MPFDISSFSSSFSRIKPSPSSTLGKMLRSSKSKNTKQPESVLRVDGISRSRKPDVTNENWTIRKKYIDNQKAFKNYAEDYVRNLVNAKPNGLPSSEERWIANDVAMKTQQFNRARKPVPLSKKDDSGYINIARKSSVKLNTKSVKLSPWDRQCRSFELQRVMQSIPAWILKEHPQIANSFKEDRSHYTNSMYDQAIKNYQAFIPADFL